jgi:hypothetical protein
MARRVDECAGILMLGIRMTMRPRRDQSSLLL